MKKALIFASIIIVVISSLFLTFKIVNKVLDNDNNDNNNHDIRQLNSLKIMSQHNEYILAEDEVLPELTTYAVFKEVKYESYEKIISLGSGGIYPESILWLEDKLYINYRDTIHGYDLINKIELNSIYLSPINHVSSNCHLFGYDENYIYCSLDNYKYYKVDYELKTKQIITEDELPSNLKK